MLETPAFIQVDLLNGSKVSGRVVRFADPTLANANGAFTFEDVEGTKSYILWCAIVRVTVFPLNASKPEAAPLEKAEPAA